jgi:chromosome segregation protein
VNIFQLLSFQDGYEQRKDMKLKKLELTGFKSFHEKTSLHFPPGISAVVGPNGCGKSNVMDALRWVMGEQSVRQLRGKSMEDVIFAGTSGIPMMNMAEVSLTLINDNGSAPESLRDFSEIMLTRRIYRSGDTAYLINKQPCRLKDIHNVFMGSGMGAKSYALIQQGNIGAITEASPEERRGFIEEAAGTTRYKASKAEALRKLESTQQDMLRLMDILSEVSRQMKTLERQVQKAERYRKTQKKVRRLDIRLGLHSHDSLSTDIQRHQSLLTEASDLNASCQSRFNQLEADIAAIKIRHTQLHETLSGCRTRKFECRRQIDKLENDLAHVKQDMLRLTAENENMETSRCKLAEKTASITQEISDLEQQADRAQIDFDTFSATLDAEKIASQSTQSQLTVMKKARDAAHARLVDLTGREARHQHAFQHACSSRETLKRRLKRADEEELTARKALTESEKAECTARNALQFHKDEVIRLTACVDAQKQRLDASRHELSLQMKTTRSLDMEKTRTASRYGALKKMADNFEWYHGGVRAVMKEVNRTSGADSPELSGIIGPVADILNPEPAYEAALEAAMGESLQYLLASDVPSGLRAISFLEDRQAGRCGFIPMDAVVTPQTDIESPADRLIRHVHVRPEYGAVAEALIGHVVLAESLEDAVRIQGDAPSGQLAVTREGHVVSPIRIVIGGSSDAASGILAKKNELSALEMEISRITQALDAAHNTQSAMEADVRRQEGMLQECTAQKQTAAQEEAEAEKLAYKAVEMLKQVRRRLETAQLEQEQIGGEDTDMEADVARNETILLEIRQEISAVQAEITDTAEAIQSLSRETEAANQRWMECRVQQTALNAELENARSTLDRLMNFREDALQRNTETLQKIEKNGKKLSDGALRIETDEDRLQQASAQIHILDEELQRHQAEYDALDQEMADSSARLDSIHQEREKTLEHIRLLELDISRMSLKQESIQTRLTETYHRPFPEIRREAADAAESEEHPSVPDMENELSRLRARIAGIGDVNLEAISEYEGLKTRFDFLEAQREDLNKAMDDLHKLIQKINRVTQERFMETFLAINEKIQDIFPRLFEGGSAQLVLTDPGKPLETGVEFLIQPPGKKLTRISLLSGGEKALSAIAFIFSIFLIKPAAFCLMDEIDAPLDESNVFRFNHLLKLIGQNSQIVMITHNKHSMSFADTLLGITMEKKGVSKVVSVNLEKQGAGSGEQEAG